jgi:hypothetical protein
MSLVSYRLRLFGCLVGELEIESDDIEIHVAGMLDDDEHLVWGEEPATVEQDPVEIEPQPD